MSMAEIQVSAIKIEDTAMEDTRAIGRVKMRRQLEDKGCLNIIGPIKAVPGNPIFQMDTEPDGASVWYMTGELPEVPVDPAAIRRDRHLASHNGTPCLHFPNSA